MLLAFLAALALGASDAWTPKCTTRDDPSVWFVLTGAAGTQAETKDFNCQGLFFGSASCTQSVAMGKINFLEYNNLGKPVYELRYLPAGDLARILGFMEKPGGGVVYNYPTPVGLSPAATPPPPTTAELLRGFLAQRNKASAATKGVTINLWTCPAASFTPPDDVITPVGMTVQRLEPIAPLQ